MKYETEVIFSSYYPLRIIQDNEIMLNNEFKRITTSRLGNSTSLEPSLYVIKQRLSQLEEVKKLILSIGVNEC